MTVHIIHPPHAKWLRECCNRHLWPEVIRQAKTLISSGDAVPNAMDYFKYEISYFNDILDKGEAGDGLLLVAPPKGMTIETLLERVQELDEHGH